MQAPTYSSSLDACLKSAKDWARLAAHAERLLALQQIYAQIAPSYLAEASQVANYRSGKVVVHAANGAVAAKIRQLGATLRDDFCKRGADVTEVLVRVQVCPPAPVEAPRRRGGLPPGALRSLSRLAAELPDSPLRGSINALLSRAR